MTSMPASRNARAMTLAPRSWPSRPGLATSTRILRSLDIGRFFAADARGGWRIRRTAKNTTMAMASSWGFCVQAAPQIPGSYAAVGMPGAGDLFHLTWGGQLAFLVGALDGGAHAVIADGQHVLAAQRKNQEHVRAPHANAFHFGQPLDDLFFGERGQRGKIEFAGLSAPCQVANVGNLLPR